MKLSTTVDGLIVTCESFEGGKEKSFIRMPEVTLAEWGYLFLLILLSYLAGFNPLAVLTSIITNFEADWRSHQFGSIILLLFFITTGAKIVYALFFKTFARRVTSSYRIDRDGSFHYLPNFGRIIEITSDRNIVDLIDGIELTEGVRSYIAESYVPRTNYNLIYESPPTVQIATNYQVIVRFNSGASSIIESNGLAVWHCDDDQIAFRELITETQAAVEQVKIFLAASKLAASKNEIAPPSH
jgi:hypothetical protein